MLAQAVALECMRGAHRQQRACYLYAFSGPRDVKELELKVPTQCSMSCNAARVLPVGRLLPKYVGARVAHFTHLIQACVAARHESAGGRRLCDQPWTANLKCGLLLKVDAPSLLELLAFLQYSFGGGTDVDRPLELSLDRLEQKDWAQASTPSFLLS